MKHGFCISLKELKMLLPYLENCNKKPLDFVDLSGVEICGLTLKETELLAECLQKYQLFCMGIHSSFPSDIKFIGKGKNNAVLKEYTRKLVERCNILDCKMIGIGSPGSRFRDGNISEEDADKQMIDTLQRIGELAGNQTVLLESIQPSETNYINSASHAERLIDRLAVQNIGLVCDIYHFFCSEEQIEYQDAAFWNKVLYLHIADPNGRQYLSENTDSFFLDYAGRIIKQARKAAGIAVEAGTERITEELPKCRDILQLLERDKR